MPTNTRNNVETPSTRRKAHEICTPHTHAAQQEISREHDGRKRHENGAKEISGLVRRHPA